MSGTTRSDDLIPATDLCLPAEAASVRTARRHLRDLLRRAGRERWADAAELALSEVATNAVLHAHTGLRLRVHVRASEVEVEVEDGNPALPPQRRGHDAEATTGRGLELVSALTRDCGVRAGTSGKVVWFTVADDQPAEPSEEELLASWASADADWSDGAGPVAQHAGEELRSVVLLALPTMLWLAAREHHHAMLRELVLYLAEHGATLRSPPDIALADAARNLVWTCLLAQLDEAQTEAVVGTGALADPPGVLPPAPEAVDLRLLVPRRLGAGFGALQDALDTAERLSVADRLLIRPGLPEIIAVRDWVCDQVVAQLQGVPPSPWPGADQSRFTELIHDRDAPAVPQWDSDLVTGSDRGVVAADDANRIIAISDPLAQAVGWTREEIVGRRIVTLIPPALREAHVAGFSRHLTTGQSSLLGVALELPVLHRDGHELPCHFLIERARVGAGRPVYLAWIEPVEGSSPSS